MSSVRALTCVVIVLGPSMLPAASRADDKPRSQTFVASGVKIHYLIAGTGDPVLLIHGLHSSADMNWRLTGVLGDLARNHLVMAVDLPGHGKSDKPENDEAYGLRLVEDMAALLDHLEIKKAHIVGYSLGSMVAGKFVVDYPDRVSSLMLGGMGWFREGSGLQAVWRNLPAREGSRTPPAFTRNVPELATTKAEIEKVDVPVKVLIGDRDPVKRLYVTPLQRIRPDWPVVEIEDAGHINCIIKPRFRQEIVGWLKR